MPLADPLVIVGKTPDGVSHFINVQTPDAGAFAMAVRTACYRLRSRFRARYPGGIRMVRLSETASAGRV